MSTAPVSQPRRRALLLGGISSDGSFSMTRYARELSIALSTGHPWDIVSESPVQRPWLTAVWRNRWSERIDSAVARYVTYPLSLRKRCADVFHVLDHGYGHLVRALATDKTVVTCHDLIPLLSARGRIPMTVPSSVARTFELRISEMSRAARVIAITEATRDTLLEYTDIPASRIVVIPYGVNSTFQPAPPHLVQASRQRFQIAPHETVILQVATRGRYKNTPAVLRAFADAHKRLGPGAMLVRIGVPLYDDEAELATSLGIIGRIRHVGMIADDDVLAEWYRVAAVLVFPSWWEGFGWPPLEAMASGTPVIASSIPAIREVVQHAAILVDPHDDRGLAEAIERVVNDVEHANDLRSRGLSRGRQLTWAETARKTAAVYGELVGGPVH